MTNTERIQANNAELREAISMAENLPDAGGGGVDHLDDFLSNTLTAIDSDVTSILSYGCYGRTAIKTVNLPKCTEINSYSFRGCSGITNVDVPLTNTLGTYAFYGCTNLASINAPKAKSLGTYVFYKAGLESVNLPLATSVPQNAFFQNENLAKADFGVASKINQSAFANCYKLDTLILRLTTAICALGTATNALQGTPIAEGTGYVYVLKQWLSDDDATKDYRRATNWVNYASQFRPLVATFADLASIDGSVYDRAWVDDENCVYIYNGSAWTK